MTPESTHVQGFLQSLVGKLKLNGSLTQTAVEGAFLAVPRHLFLPGVDVEQAYSDDAIPTKFDENGRAISSSSQPAIMAIMLEQLDLQPGHHVLEIGAGTGYNAALMAHLVGENGRITTLDIDQDIVEAAQEHLAEAGCQHVTVVCGDGMLGYPAHAPYDRIILTVGGWEIAPAWIEQLTENGRILLPLSLNGPQFSIAFAREAEHLTSLSMAACGFMPLRGEHTEPGTTLSFDDPELMLNLNSDDVSTDAATIYYWLTGPSQDWPTAVAASVPEVWRSLYLWLALREPYLCNLTAQGTAVDRNLVPPLLAHNGGYRWRMTMGLVSPTGSAWLMRAPDEPPPPDNEATFSLVIRQFGKDEAVARQLVEHVRDWDRNGRFTTDNLQIRVYPKEVPYTAVPGEIILPKRWHRFVLNWVN